MVACLHPSDQNFEENNSTLAYASKAAMIRNKPVRNDDPQTKLILELKQQVKTMSMELLRANQYIEQICTATGQPVRKFGVGMLPTQADLAKEESGDQAEQNSITSVSQKNLITKRSATRLSMPNAQSPYSVMSSKKSFVGEGSKDFVSR